MLSDAIMTCSLPELPICECSLSAINNYISTVIKILMKEIHYNQHMCNTKVITLEFKLEAM